MPRSDCDKAIKKIKDYYSDEFTDITVFDQKKEQPKFALHRLFVPMALSKYNHGIVETTKTNVESLTKMFDNVCIKSKNVRH